MLPKIDHPDEYRTDLISGLVAEHLLSRMNLDVTRSDLSHDIIGALSHSKEIAFEWGRHVTGTCDLHGTYTDTPPRIRVSRNLGAARARFTAAHELGHHLQVNDTEWALDVLAPLRLDTAFVAGDVEERVSNQVATRLLMPDDLLNAAWSGRLDPAFVRALTRDGYVSRQAASMRAMEHAATTDPRAIIVVARADGVITSARAGDGDRLAPPPVRSVQTDFADLASKPPGHVRATDGLFYASGRSRSDISYEWDWDHNGTHMFVIVRPEYEYGDANWDGDEVECLGDSCGSSFSRSVASLCTQCVKPVCPDCGACGCAKREGKLCSECYTVMSLAESQRGDVHEVCPF